ncbi:putative nicotinate phosphoribosyltransferase [Dioscorea sansibarensis]
MAAVLVNGKLENGAVEKLGGPTNPMASRFLADSYQFTTAYAYWNAGKHRDRAFRSFLLQKSFGGEYTVFGGLEECIRLIANFKFKDEEISYLRSVLSNCEDGFFDYLGEIDCSDVEVYAISEGSVVFPNVPLMRVEGPVAQSGGCEVVWHSSLWNRFSCLCYLIHAVKALRSQDGSRLTDSLSGSFEETNGSELAAFISYALALPHDFSVLVDTYDVMRSGVPNFCAVALALNDLGYKAIGIRQDSGDLACLSTKARKIFCVVEEEFGAPGFGKMLITACKNLNEETIGALN